MYLAIFKFGGFFQFARLTSFCSGRLERKKKAGLKKNLARNRKIRIHGIK